MYGIGYDKKMVHKQSENEKKLHKSLMSNPKFKKEQKDYEHSLGRYIYRENNVAKTALDDGIDRMKTLLVKYYKDIRRRPDTREKILSDAFTTSNYRDSAGQIGQANYNTLAPIINENLDQATEAANLREKMTAFYNAAYFASGPNMVEDDDHKPTFKYVIRDIAKNKNINDAKSLQKDLNLDESILNEWALSNGKTTNFSQPSRRHEFISYLYNKYGKTINKGLNRNDNPKDPYNLMRMGLNSVDPEQMINNIKNATSVHYRDKEIIEKKRRHLTYYDEMGLNLSNREKQFIVESLCLEYLNNHPILPRQKDETINDFHTRNRKSDLKYQIYMGNVLEKFGMGGVSQEKKKALDDMLSEPEKITFHQVADNPKSSIIEGKVVKTYKRTGFLGKMASKHHVRIVNGISGTTMRMLNTAKYLGVKDLLGFRLALMGWMLPTDDHSLWEIIIGSHNINVKGSEDMTDMISLDQTVAPLTEETLREKVCKDNKFPHEIVADSEG